MDKNKPLVKDDVFQILEDKNDQLNNQGLFQVNSAFHSHNGIDAPRVDYNDLVNQPISPPFLTINYLQDIQKAIDTLVIAGGGTLYLKAGTYVPKSALSIYSSVKIVGISPSQTIIDFNSTSANISFAGTHVYTTGTITVASGTAITGSGTTWVGNVLPGYSLFLGTRWYTIAAVTDNTHLVLAEAYGDNVTLPSTYRIALIGKDFQISNLTIKNSTGYGLSVTDARQFFISDVVIQNCRHAALMINVSEMVMSQYLGVASNNGGEGLQLFNVGLSSLTNVNTAGNTGFGFELNNVKTISMSFCESASNTSDGYNINKGVDITMFVGSEGNGGQGIEMVANCSNIVIANGPIRGNTSDGIKLTASATGIKVTNCDIQNNGAYGINIAVAGDAGTLLTSNYFANNTSGQMNNAGTGSIGRGNYNVADFG